MHKECEQTRNNLRRYMTGHLFSRERRRIERHLGTCILCRSRYQSLLRSTETIRFLQEIEPDNSIVRSMKTGASLLSGVTKLFYRPLWVLGIAAATAALYLYVFVPMLHDPELEKLDAPLAPPAANRDPVTVSVASQTVPTPAAEVRKAAPVVPEADPMVVTVSVEDEKAAIKRLNEALKEHAMLRTRRFTESVKEISGSMTAHELHTLFNRIQGIGRITYKNSRLEASESGEVLPFVLRLKAAPRPAVKAAERPADTGALPAAEKPAPNEAPKPSEKADVKAVPAQ